MLFVDLCNHLFAFPFRISWLFTNMVKLKILRAWFTAAYPSRNVFSSQKYLLACSASLFENFLIPTSPTLSRFASRCSSSGRRLISTPSPTKPSTFQSTHYITHFYHNGRRIWLNRV